MKKRIRIISLCLSLVLLCSAAFTSCGVNTSGAVSYKDEKVTKALFQYLCSMKKTNYLYEAYGLDQSSVSSSQLQDDAAIWSAMAADGSTVADTLKSEVLDEAKLMLYMANYAQEQGYTLGDAEKKVIKAEFDKAVFNYGDKKTFNREMKQYGVNYNQLLEYNYLQTLAYQGLELLFGENGTQRVSDESVQKYYKNNYATTLCIYINTKNKTHSNGKVVVLPAEEKEEKIALAEEVYQKALGGEDFSNLVMEYSDEGKDEVTAKDGVTFRKDGFVNPQAEAKIWELQVGDIVKVETDQGIYILKRLNLNNEYFKTAKDVIRAELEEVKKFALVMEVEKEFKIDEDFLNSINIAEIPHVV